MQVAQRQLQVGHWWSPAQGKRLWTTTLSETQQEPVTHLAVTSCTARWGTLGDMAGANDPETVLRGYESTGVLLFGVPPLKLQLEMLVSYLITAPKFKLFSGLGPLWLSNWKPGLELVRATDLTGTVWGLYLQRDLSPRSGEVDCHSDGWTGKFL